MKALAVFLLVFVSVSTASAQPVVVIVRHAEKAATDLQHVIGEPPRVASPERLDEVGHATRRLEVALGEGGSPFAKAMKAGMGSIEALTDEVEANYKLDLD